MIDLSTIIGAIAGSLLGSGGIYALMRVGPERRKTSTEIHSSVLEDLSKAYERTTDELGQLRMEMMTREMETEECRKKVHELQVSITFLQRDLDRHGRLSIMNFTLNCYSLRCATGRYPSQSKCALTHYARHFRLRWRSWKKWNLRL